MLSIVLALLLQGAPAAPPVSETSGATIVNPDWIRRPTADDLRRLYPAAAARKNVPGRATISCGVGAEGLLINCTVTEESPSGEGFGEAALKMASAFKLRPLTRNGQPVEGGTVRIPLRFAIDNRIDPLSALLACYGQTAAAAEKDPTNAAAVNAYGFFAAQAAIQHATSHGKPEALETALRTARLGAPLAAPQWGPSLKDCLAFSKKGG